MFRLIPEITVERENFRIENLGDVGVIRRDPVEPLPVGAHVAMAFRIAGPDIDCEHLRRQIAWSTKTFGPGRRTGGLLDHIRKELAEIEADPDDWTEWVDVVILALDGAWRHGAEPRQLLDAIVAKQATNEQRVWPDWRTRSEDQAIEDDRTCDGGAA